MKVLIGKYPKSKGKRKVFVRIDPHDTYSMDRTLALIIVPMLKQLKKTKHGIPSEMFPDPGCAEADEKAAIKLWNDTLNKMIWSFTQVGRDWERKFWSGRHDIKWKKLENGYVEMQHGPKDTAKYDREGAEAYSNRIQEGIDLFAKHYFSLWD